MIATSQPRCLAPAVVALAAFAAQAAAQIQLVRDFNPGTGPSSAYWFTTLIGGVGTQVAAVTASGLLVSDGTVNGTSIVRSVPHLADYDNLTGFATAPRVMQRAADILFLCVGPAYVELWRTDCTFTGTNLVKRLDESSYATSTPAPVRPSAVLGNVGIFTLETPGTGRELWRTDGTAPGTFLLRDIATGTAGSDPDWLCVLQSRVYFAADDGVTGRELWATDGTVNGTVRVSDIRAGAAGSAPSDLCVWNGAVYFSADDGIQGAELWRSNGTAIGTTLVRDIEPGALGSEPEELADGGAFLCFAAGTSLAGFEPWRSDGTTAGTTLIADTVPGAAGPVPFSFCRNGARVYYWVHSNQELWSTDGTAGGTYQMTLPAWNAPRLSPLVAYGSFVYFVAQHSGLSPSLYRCGPLPGTTSLVATLPDFTYGLQNANNLLFTAREPWRSDGTTNGTFALIQAGVDSYVGSLLLPHGQALLTASGTWVSDGTAGGTQLIHPGLNPVFLNDLNSAPVADGASAVFNGYDTSGYALWKSDGTVAGTSSVVNGVYAFGLAHLPATTCFFADDGVHGEELWRTDGTALGSSIVLDIHPGAAGSIASTYMQGTPPRLDGRILFYADDGTHGAEIWVSDGTAAGTTLLKDVNPGQSGSVAASTTPIVAAGNRAFFVADDGAHGRELWVTDGTTAGTSMVVDLQPGSASSDPVPGAALGNRLLFSLATAAVGNELWISDGTAAGTTLLEDVNPGPRDSFLGPFVSGTTLCFFTGYDDAFGHELWRTDGTPAGTFRVTDTCPGIESGDVYVLRVFEDRDVALFAATSPAHGRELWLSDGTTAGSYEVQDLQPGASGSWPSSALPANNRLLLSAWTDPTGYELFGGDLQTILGGLGLSLPIGLGCPGTHGVPTLRSTQPPVYGNSQFGFELATGLPGAPALLGGALLQADTLLGNGCWFHLLPPAAMVFRLTDPSGKATLGMPLPNSPTFLGVNLLLQGGVVDPQGAFQGVAVSKALRVIIGSH